jgi:hypothetical protein
MAVSVTLLAFMVSLTWDCVSRTNRRIKNAAYSIVLVCQEVLEELVRQSGVVFAPQLFNILMSETPPTVADLETIPLRRGDWWAVYILILTKSGFTPGIYIGSGTNAKHGAIPRMQHYDKQTHLPRYVESALNDGYTITHRGYLCWAPLPRTGKVYLTRLLFLALESTLCLVLWAMRSRDKDYGLPRLCPWPIEVLEYRGFCSHIALYEHITGEEAGLTPEQIAAKEVEQEETRREVKRWFNAATRHLRQACKRRNVEEQKYNCDVCDQASNSQWQLDRHLATKLHKKKASGNTKLSKVVSWERRNIAAKKFPCDRCPKFFGTKQKQKTHKNSEAYAKGVCKDLRAKSSPRSA